MKNLFNNHTQKMTILASKLLSDVSEVYNFRIDTRAITIQSYLNSAIVAFCYKRKFEVVANHLGHITFSKKVGNTTIEVIITD